MDISGLFRNTWPHSSSFRPSLLQLLKLHRDQTLPIATRNMPNKKSSSASRSNPQQNKEKVKTETVNNGPVSMTKDGNIAIAIHVKPGAKTNSITSIDEVVNVQIAAPPVDGEANTEIVKYFANLLDLRKSDVSLKGGKSRDKVVTVDSSTGNTVDTVLKQLMSNKHS